MADIFEKDERSVSSTTGNNNFHTPRNLSANVSRPTSDLDFKNSTQKRNGNNSPFRKSGINYAKKPDYEEKRIIRMHYANLISQKLNMMEQCAPGIAISLYYGEFLSYVDEMLRYAKDEPYLNIVLALHDALVCDDRWLTYTPEQYTEAKAILEDAACQREVNMNYYQKSLQRLEDSGFSTLPFSLDDIDFDAED